MECIQILVWSNFHDLTQYGADSDFEWFLWCHQMSKSWSQTPHIGTKSLFRFRQKYLDSDKNMQHENHSLELASGACWNADKRFRKMKIFKRALTYLWLVNSWIVFFLLLLVIKTFLMSRKELSSAQCDSGDQFKGKQEWDSLGQPGRGSKAMRSIFVVLIKREKKTSESRKYVQRSLNEPSIIDEDSSASLWMLSGSSYHDMIPGISQTRRVSLYHRIRAGRWGLASM